MTIHGEPYETFSVCNHYFESALVQLREKQGKSDKVKTKRGGKTDTPKILVSVFSILQWFLKLKCKESRGLLFF